jgi:hypothetical protein
MPVPDPPALTVVVVPAATVSLVGAAPALPRAGRAPAARSRRTLRAVPPVALGSLTQPGARTGDTCRCCGSVRVTSLALMLTDGTPVRFTSCHACEHRTWVGPDGALDRATVLERTRKLR